MLKSKVLILSAFVFTSMFVAACTKSPEALTPSPTPEPTASPASELPTNTKKKAEYEFTATQSSQLAEKLITSSAQVETKDYGSAGKFVTSINGLEANEQYYWAFYLNGKYAEKGISQTTLAKGDTIKFVYEAITATK